MEAKLCPLFQLKMLSLLIAIALLVAHEVFFPARAGVPRRDRGFEEGLRAREIRAPRLDHQLPAGMARNE